METPAQGVLFDERFLDRHAGAIVSDPTTAIVELVANAWDAYATEVHIQLSDMKAGAPFSIRDNGIGMTVEEFLRRWGTLDYNRLLEQGPISAPPTELAAFGPRHPYGRNGRGRHAAFAFSDQYIVRTWRDGQEASFQVSRGSLQPFELETTRVRDGVAGHGTEIRGVKPRLSLLTAETSREIIGTRFLSDPNFSVSVDGIKVSFDDIPKHQIKIIDVNIGGFGTAKIFVIDSQKADKTTRHHGMAWRVQNRLVGKPGWSSVHEHKIIDGRTTEAKRFQFIVFADHLEEAVLPDWSGFKHDHEGWTATRDAVHNSIISYLNNLNAQRRQEAKEDIKENLAGKVTHISPAGRDRWNQFVDSVVDNCPSIDVDDIKRIADILAQLEISTSKFGLIEKLHQLDPSDFDSLNSILTDWTVRLAKDALDEIQSRLRLIEELDCKLRDERMDEVGDLQPLLARSLWVFGPEFESIEFTSNRGMTEVIRRIFSKDIEGSRLRPDFVVLPEGSAGFYSRDSHDAGHEVSGIAQLVIVEIKKVGVRIGSKEKSQPWDYVKELMNKGLLNETSRITCFVLGSMIDPAEAGDDKRGNDRVHIRPMTYNTFIRRAEKRMLGLREKLHDAPFLKEVGLDVASFVSPPEPIAPNLFDLSLKTSENLSVRSNGGAKANPAQ